MKFWARYKLNRKVEKHKFRQRLKGKDNQIFVMNIILLTLMIVFVLCAILFFVVGPLNVFTEYSYQVSKNDDVIKVVVDYCQFEEDDDDKIYCVNKFVNNNFDYLITERVISPDDLIENGGDCKSWTNFYITTLRQLGVKVKQNFDSVDKHTFLIADTDNGYCVIDQQNVDCSYLGSRDY